MHPRSVRNWLKRFLRADRAGRPRQRHGGRIVRWVMACLVVALIPAATSTGSASASVEVNALPAPASFCAAIFRHGGYFGEYLLNAP